MRWLYKATLGFSTLASVNTISSLYIPIYILKYDFRKVRSRSSDKTPWRTDLGISGVVEGGRGGGRRPVEVAGHSEAGPLYKLHQYRSNDPRDLEGLFYG